MYKFIYYIEGQPFQVFIREDSIEKALSIYRENYNGDISMITKEDRVDIIN